jgi:hypothetical protein
MALMKSFLTVSLSMTRLPGLFYAVCSYNFGIFLSHLDTNMYVIKSVIHLLV